MTAQAIAVAVSGTADVAAFTGPCTLRGWSLREDAGTAAVATVRIWDGTSATGTVLAAIELAANASTSQAIPDGLRAALGVFVEVVAGSVEGSVWIG